MGRLNCGGVAEWFNAADLKSVERQVVKAIRRSVGSNPTASATLAPPVVYLARTPALQAGKTGSYPVRGLR